LEIDGLRSYVHASLELGRGPHLVWGPNGSGKTTLLEAVTLVAWGRSPRATSDREVVRWGAPLARVAATVAEEGTETERTIDVVIAGEGAVGLPAKRVRVDGVPRRVAGLAGILRVVLFTPEELELVGGPPVLRREAVDRLAAQLWPAQDADLASLTRALAQRNRLLRAIQKGEAEPRQLRPWSELLVERGAAIVARRREVLAALTEPLAQAHRELAPEEPTQLALTYRSTAEPAPGESLADALRRRLEETAEREIWHGATLVGPHRDDIVFTLGERELAGFASRGQERTAVLAFTLAQVELLTALDGRPPLLLLDDVFSELDRRRRAHLVERVLSLPQSLVTTTGPGEVDERLLRASWCWEVEREEPSAGRTDPPTARIRERGGTEGRIGAALWESGVEAGAARPGVGDG
jgi:DNA replication and repair protein RecF